MMSPLQTQQQQHHQQQQQQHMVMLQHQQHLQNLQKQGMFVRPPAPPGASFLVGQPPPMVMLAPPQFTPVNAGFIPPPNHPNTAAPNVNNPPPPTTMNRPPSQPQQPNAANPSSTTPQNRIELIRQYYAQLMANLRTVTLQLQHLPPSPPNDLPDPNAQRRAGLLTQQERFKKALQEFTERVMRNPKNRQQETTQQEAGKGPASQSPQANASQDARKISKSPSKASISRKSSPVAPETTSMSEIMPAVSPPKKKAPPRKRPESTNSEKSDSQTASPSKRKRPTASPRPATPKNNVQDGFDDEPYLGQFIEKKLADLPETSSAQEGANNELILPAFALASQEQWEAMEQFGWEIMQDTVEIARARIDCLPNDVVTIHPADMLLAVGKRLGRSLARYELEVEAGIPLKSFQLLDGMAEGESFSEDDNAPTQATRKKTHLGPHHARIAQIRRHLASLQSQQPQNNDHPQPIVENNAQMEED